VHKLERFVGWLDKLVDLSLAEMLSVAMVEWVGNCQPSKTKSALLSFKLASPHMSMRGRANYLRSNAFQARQTGFV